MAMLTFTVEGVVGKQRPRMGKMGVYTPSKTVKYERLIKKSAMQAMKDAQLEPTDKPLRVDVRAFYAVPKSYTKARRGRCIDGTEQPNKKPDIDNVVKSILDGMNGVVYQDDKQVVKLTAVKHYTGNDAYVLVRVSTIDDKQELGDAYDGSN